MLFSPRPFLKSGDTDNSCIRFAATGLKFHLTLEREEKNLAFVKFEHIYIRSQYRFRPSKKYILFPWFDNLVTSQFRS